eukprot:scaffold279357_cov21-Prasinocladus_malaysianus.AAC.1
MPSMVGKDNDINLFHQRAHVANCVNRFGHHLAKGTKPPALRLANLITWAHALNVSFCEFYIWYHNDKGGRVPHNRCHEE